MSNARIHNTKRILFSGILNLLINSILPFINRTIIIKFLGSEFTGLAGLFGSILQVLSLAEFGFSMVIVYYLYEPLAKNDNDAINRILTWLRSIFHIVGSIIIGGGLVCTPFLTHLIHGSYPENINIYILFLIYLFNSGTSYFLFAYKEVLLIADQKKDVITNIRSVITLLVNCFQFIALIVLKNYYFYALLLIVGTISNNILVNRAVKKRYPYLKISTEKTPLPDSTKKELVGLMINRLSNVSRNAFDNLIISSTLGLVATSIYGNYYMIYSAVLSMAVIVCGSIQAGIGNSIAVRSKKDNYENLLDFSMLYSWITGWCAVTMACLYQPFMKLWVGKSLMLSDINMLLFVAYFYLISMNHIRNQYILGNAFWWKLKWTYLTEAAGNLLLNVLLGKLFGITGVLIATIITIFICNYLMCNSVLFKTYFEGESIGVFYKQQFYYLAVAVVVTAIVYIVCLNFENIIIRALICAIMPNCLFVAFYRPCSRWKSSMNYIGRFIKSR